MNTGDSDLVTLSFRIVSWFFCLYTFSLYMTECGPKMAPVGICVMRLCGAPESSHLHP